MAAPLLAVLLPALAKARYAARETACLSNLRQITMGVVMYANENRNRLPFSGRGFPGNGLSGCV